MTLDDAELKPTGLVANIFIKRIFVRLKRSLALHLIGRLSNPPGPLAILLGR
jgi:hypothetical protein